MPVPGGTLGSAVLELTGDATRLMAALRQSELATAAAVKSIEGAATRAETAAGTATNNAATRMSANAKKIDNAFTTMAKVATAAFVGIGIVSMKAAIDFESSFAGVRKTVDGTDEELNEIASAFRNMAKEIPVNVNELNRIGEAAGQLGVKKADIVGFTETVAKLGATTNLTGDTGATAMARFMNVMGTTGGEVDNLASTIVALGNSGASTEQEILEMGQRISGAGVIVGLTEDEVLGFANALSSLGINAEAGGSAFSRVIIDMSVAVANGGKDLEAFADVAGMSAAEFKQAYEKDASAAIVTFVQGLGRIRDEGGNVFAILDKMGLADIRVRNALLSMAAGSDTLTASLQTGAQAWEDNTALEVEFGKRAETTASQIQIAKNRINDVAITLGTQLLPSLAGAAEGLAGFIEAFAGLPQSTQNLLLVGGAITALSPLLVNLGRSATIAFKAFQTNGLIGGLGTKAGLLGGLLAVTVAVVALDFALQKFTGKGLLDFIKGAETDADRLAKRLAELDERFKDLDAAGSLRALQQEFSALADASSNLDEVKRRIDETGLTMEEFAKIRLTGDNGAAMLKDIETFNRASDEAEAYGAALRKTFGDGEAAVKIYREEHDKLEPSLRAAFEAGVEWNSVLAFEADQLRVSEAAMTDWTNEMNDAALASGELGAEAAAATNGIDDFTRGIEDAEDAAKELEKRLDSLIESYGEANPAVQMFGAKNALLVEGLADLDYAMGDAEKSSEDYSSSLGMTRGEIEATIAANDREANSFIANAEALRGLQALLVTVMGEAGYGGILTAMNNAGRGVESQIDLLGGLVNVYDSLATDNIPAAIEGLAHLKASMSAEEWETVAAAVGPKLISEINNGIADPAQRATLIASLEETLGITMTSGQEKAAEAAQVGEALIAAVASVLGPEHPSVIAMKAALDTAITDMNSSGTAKAAIASEIGTAMLKALGEALGVDSPAYKAAKAALDGALADLTSTAPTAEKSGTTVGWSAGWGVEQGISSKGQAIIDASRGVAGSVALASDTATVAGTTTGEAGGGGIVTGISNLTENIIAEARARADSIADAAADAASAGTTTGEAGGGGFVTGLGNMLDAIVTEARARAQSIADAADTATAAGTTAGEAGGSGFATGLGNQTDTVSGASITLAGAVEDAEGTARGSGLVVGSAAGQGLAQGIESQRDSVLRTAASIASEAAKTMAGVLEVFSPSRVTRRIGERTSEGLAVGITTGGPEVEDAAEGVALGAARGAASILPGFDILSSGRAGMASPSMAPWSSISAPSIGGNAASASRSLGGVRGGGGREIIVAPELHFHDVSDPDAFERRFKEIWPGIWERTKDAEFGHEAAIWGVT